jgi:hypothetical protein
VYAMSLVNAFQLGLDPATDEAEAQMEASLTTDDNTVEGNAETSEPTVATRSIGHYPAYVDLANQTGAKYFSIPDDIWSSMSEEAQWTANRTFLDRGIARGDTFLLATPVDEMRAGSYYEEEVNYLLNNGYTFNDEGNAMVRAR